MISVEVVEFVERRVIYTFRCNEREAKARLDKLYRAAEADYRHIIRERIVGVGPVRGAECPACHEKGLRYMTVIEYDCDNCSEEWVDSTPEVLI